MAGVLLFTGTLGSSALTFIWLAGCVAMMSFMTRAVGGTGHGDTRQDETRDDVANRH